MAGRQRAGVILSAVPMPPPATGESAAAAAVEQASFWVWCGAHGGAGVTTLAAAIPGGVDLGRRLPWEAGVDELPAVVVCRSTAAGLSAARDFAAAASGRTDLLGLVVVADIPERKRPKVLTDSLYVTRGAFGGRVWEMPWVGSWRLGEPPGTSNNPRQVKDLLRALWGAVNLPLPGESTDEQRRRQ